MQGSFISSSLINVNKLKPKTKYVTEKLKKRMTTKIGLFHLRDYLELLNLKTGAHCEIQSDIVDISSILCIPSRVHSMSCRTLSMTSDNLSTSLPSPEGKTNFRTSISTCSSTDW